MQYNAYDLRKSGYRYLRGNSAYIEKAESFFDNGIIVPSGMAAISLLFQYLRPRKIWYPYDLYQGTFELISYLGLEYDDKAPDVVIYDCPSFGGNLFEFPKFENSPVIIADNSVMPDVVPRFGFDYLVTSLSKYHTDCRTVLGLITVKNNESLKDLKEFRWKSGYVVFRSQCEVLFGSYGKLKGKKFKKKLASARKRAFDTCCWLDYYDIKYVLSGALVFIMVPDNIDAEAFAKATPFSLRPTYGADKTFCSYSYCEDNYRYFGTDSFKGSFLRISPGEDFSPERIGHILNSLFIKFRKKVKSFG